MRPRELKATAVDGNFRLEVEDSGGHSWVLDEPVDKGGTDTGTTPVEAFLGALVGCLITAFQFHARRKNVPIQKIEGWVASNESGYLNQIAVDLQVWSPAPEEQVRELLPRAERGCFVKAVLRPDLPYSVDLAVYPAEEAAGEPVTLGAH
ncbi:MAG: OsmC family protein [Dehalococcoidia bacterium]|nr:OsmC family protein [Dehalococcoidia bacterium]